MVLLQLSEPVVWNLGEGWNIRNLCLSLFYEKNEKLWLFSCVDVYLSGSKNWRSLKKVQKLVENELKDKSIKYIRKFVHLEGHRQDQNLKYSQETIIKKLGIEYGLIGKALTSLAENLEWKKRCKNSWRVELHQSSFENWYV